MQPIVNGLETDYGTEMTFLRLDARDGGEGQQLFSQLGLPGHPSILIFDVTGERVYRGVGIISDEQLREAITMAITDNR